jgi:hypothetical protein
MHFLLLPEERFYLQGRDLETRGECRAGAYQELAADLVSRTTNRCSPAAKQNGVRSDDSIPGSPDS